MNLLLILRVALKALLRNKIRSLLTALGIIAGIAAVIAVVAISQGARAAMIGEISSIGNNLIIILPGSTKEKGAHAGMGSNPTLTAEDGYAILRELPHLAAAATPFIRSSSQVVHKENNWYCLVEGVSGDYPAVRNWAVEWGTFFSEDDQASRRRVCVLGQTVVSQIFPDGSDPVGKTIRVGNMPFQVVGVMQRKGSNPIGQDQDDVILAPYTTVNNVLQKSHFNNVHVVMVSLHSLDILDEAKKEIRALLRQRHKIPPGAEDDFSLVDMAEIIGIISSVTRLMTLLLTMVASISLIVGGIGIMNIMLVSVTERTREIGLRMAVGATPGDILLQFLAEAMALSTAGGIFGIFFGVAGAKFVGNIQHWPILVTEFSVVVAFFFSATVGMFFGFYPALRASRLNPIDCLRYE